ncbi:MAG: biotin--[acetyl-CoA-carboxylase] ligase [Flavobacteriales bacterium]
MDLLYPITEIYLDRTASTNSFLLNKNVSFKEWTVVSARIQEAGKGYRGNTWKSDAGKNLTFSIYIKPDCLIEQIFYLNKLVSNAIHKTLQAFISCKIKWPNDIIINHKKAGGILIENVLGEKVNSSVIGIGLNINQIYFTNLPKATSLKNETGLHFNLDELRNSIIFNFQKEYQLLINQEFERIDHYFQKHLYKKDQVGVFKIQNQLENGIIKGTTPEGKLIIDLEKQGLQTFQLKEIEMMY